MTKQEALKLLDDRKWLAERLPEVLALEKCLQLGPFHLEGDVLTHTKLVVAGLPDNASSGLIWAGILHDVAKPLTLSRKERGGEIITQFIEHEKIGSELVLLIADRLELKATEKEIAWWLVRNHMRIASLPLMREFKIREFVASTYFPELIELFKADIAASHSRTEELRQNKIDLVRQVEEIYRSYLDFKK